MLSTTDSTAPNVDKKRPFSPEQAGANNNADSKRRRYDSQGNAAESNTVMMDVETPLPGLTVPNVEEDGTDVETTQPSLALSEVEGDAASFGEQHQRGRARWRAGSEPREWDFVTWYYFPEDRAAASYGDDHGEEKFCHHGSKSMTAHCPQNVQQA